MTARKEVYKAIDGERDFQDTLNSYELAVSGEILLLEEYIKRARVAYTNTFGDPTEKPTRNIVRKVAAIAVRCLENHDVVTR